MSACVYSCTRRADLALGVFLSLALPYFLRQSHTLTPELTDSLRLAGHQAIGNLLLSVFLALGLKACLWVSTQILLLACQILYHLTIRLPGP